jgi:serine protease AprX
VGNHGLVRHLTDIGIDSAHVDLACGKVIAWNDWVNNRSSPYDDNGHGTHVSGIVAGTGAGNPAYKGVAPGAALIGLKVLNNAGSGSLSSVAAAVDWAVQHKELCCTDSPLIRSGVSL